MRVRFHPYLITTGNTNNDVPLHDGIRQLSQENFGGEGDGG